VRQSHGLELHPEVIRLGFQVAASDGHDGKL
jgi:hypothetical protein